MRRVTVIVLFILTAGAAFGQVSSPVSASLGLHLNGGSLSRDPYGWGWGAGAHLDIEIPVVRFRVSGDYQLFLPEKNTGAENTKLFSGTANVQLPILPLPVVKPYVTGGVGIATLTAGDNSDTNPSINVGAGVNFSFILTAFAEVRYNWILTEGKATGYIPLTVGITF
jgi:hypothetical protein